MKTINVIFLFLSFTSKILVTTDPLSNFTNLCKEDKCVICGIAPDDATKMCTTCLEGKYTHDESKDTFTKCTNTGMPGNCISARVVTGTNSSKDGTTCWRCKEGFAPIFNKDCKSNVIEDCFIQDKDSENNSIVCEICKNFKGPSSDKSKCEEPSASDKVTDCEYYSFNTRSSKPTCNRCVDGKIIATSNSGVLTCLDKTNEEANCAQKNEQGDCLYCDWIKGAIATDVKTGNVQVC